MKRVKASLLSLACAGLFFSMGTAGQTVVRQLDNGQLSVVDYTGKPPFKRRLVSEQDGELWQRYSALVDSVRVADTRMAQAGPPGKNRPAQVARIDRVPAAELTTFARFEETGEPANTRLWRGAPGKGRPQLGR